MSGENTKIEDLCLYENAECSRRSLPKESFCNYHLDLEKSSNYKHCSYVFDSLQKYPCENLVLKDTNYNFCYKHSLEQEPSAHSFNVENKQNPCGLLLSQKIDRQEEIFISMSKVDLIDCWSSDGDSVSSSSSSENSFTIDVVEPISPPKRKKSINLLRRAQTFSEIETLNMAIDRWIRYYRMCYRLFQTYKVNMIKYYTPYAVRKYLSKKTPSRHSTNQSKFETKTLNVSNSQSNDFEIYGDGEKKTYENQEMKLLRSLYNSRISRERTALRKFGRHSVRVANQRYQNAVSKYAIMCSLLAPWKKNTSGQITIQQCKYKDPTLTTWEKFCNQTAVPLTSFCFQHLVRNTSFIGNLQINADPHIDADYHNSSSYFDFSPNFDLSTSPLAGHSPTSAISSAGVTPSSDGSTVKQCLFRSCGHISNDTTCNQPVIGWNPYSRCPKHTTVQDLWPQIQNSINNNSFISVSNNNNSEVSLTYDEILSHKEDEYIQENQIKEENLSFNNINYQNDSREEKKIKKESIEKEDESLIDMQNHSSQTNATDSATDEVAAKEMEIS